MSAIVEMRQVSKKFGDVVANRNVSFSVRKGEVHALMGENGAGKSTLMSMLYGMQRPDQGQILVDEQVVDLDSAKDAIALGIGMVHQAFRLFESMTVWENVVYASEPSKGFLISRKTARSRVAQLSAQYRLDLNPDARISSLSVGLRQRVEILKAVYRGARILILDEPTAVLTPVEKDGLFAVMRELIAQGGTILFVSHKLHEIMEITDRITVLRDGTVTSELQTALTSSAEIIRAMTGRDLVTPPARNDRPAGSETLCVKDLSVKNRHEKPSVDHVSFCVKRGEIVGIAGVSGNGQAELIRAITGLGACTSGQVSIDGTNVTVLPVHARRRAGLAYIPEDRVKTGSAAQLSATDNLSAGFHVKQPLRQRWLLQKHEMNSWAKKLIRSFEIKIAGESTPVGTLSGGNLQKIVVARELSWQVPLVIAEQPTRGVDVGAMEFIHKQLLAERDAGRSVLLVSAELSEIMALSDRVLVMYEGRVVADLPISEVTEGRLGLFMAGREEETQ